MYIYDVKRVVAVTARGGGGSGGAAKGWDVEESRKWWNGRAARVSKRFGCRGVCEGDRSLTVAARPEVAARLHPTKKPRAVRPGSLNSGESLRLLVDLGDGDELLAVLFAELAGDFGFDAALAEVLVGEFLVAGGVEVVD